jgi:hypothetical protein
MKVTNILKVGMILGAGLFAAACSDSKDDPGTESKSDLNPPGTLWTVTQDSAIELRWTAGNVEEDLNGYYVFYTEASKILDANGILASVKPTYPAGVNVGLSGIPRCADNTKFFEAFGFKASDKECEDDTAAEGGTTAGATTAGLTGGNMLAGDTGTATGTETTEEKLTGFAKCDGVTAAEPSLPATPPVVSMQKCKITGLTNGKTYAFFVMAARDDLTKVSWTSNVLSDTPSADALPDTSLDLVNGQFARVTIDVATAKATLGTVESCDDEASPCSRISAKNNVSTDAPTVFLSRTAAGITDFTQRLYISASTDGTVKIQPRGPQTWDPLLKAKANRIPGDEAATVYPEAGQKYVVYNNQVFDLAVTASGSTYYGKLVVSDVVYAGTTRTDSAKVNLAVILQPQAGSADYFKTVQMLRQ